jgi:hypothetical protein
MILNEGVNNVKNLNDINNQNMIRVREFVNFIEEVSQNTDKESLNKWVTKYK